jgi:DNA-binding response OmpR family regulator
MPSSRHVLIAESDRGVRALLSRAVARTYPGVTISVVTSGATAFTVYEEVGADLLITAHRLPTLSGLSLVRALRALRATIPILVISSDPLEEAALALGATRFLRKPFRLTELQAILLTLLPREIEAGGGHPPADE